MDWQFGITICLIALAAGYLLWRSFAVWRSTRAGGCGGGCGCAKTTTAASQPAVIAPEQLTLRSPPVNERS